MISWAPRPDTAVTIDLVAGILDQYSEQLPPTLPQIFYILVGRHGLREE